VRTDKGWSVLSLELIDASQAAIDKYIAELILQVCDEALSGYNSGSVVSFKRESLDKFSQVAHLVWTSIVTVSLS
jgi:hypothetical protein